MLSLSSKLGKHSNQPTLRDHPTAVLCGSFAHLCEEYSSILPVRKLTIDKGQSLMLPESSTFVCASE